MLLILFCSCAIYDMFLYWPNNLLRFQGKALFAMVGITTGGVLNMVLDPIFIFGLDMGTAGAALATQGFPSLSAFCIPSFM